MSLALWLTLLFSPSALDDLEAARVLVNDDPKRGIPALKDALVRLEDERDRLRTDESARKARLDGRLTLARALLASGDTAGAAALMDAVIRSVESVPASEFGPGMETLHGERMAALEREGRGKLQFVCEIPCVLYIDEEPREPNSLELFPAEYRVRLVARESGSDVPPLEVEIQVETATTKDVVFGPVPEAPPLPTPDLNARSPRGKRGSRLMPRYVEIIGLVMGGAIAATGGVLIGLEGTCPGGDDPDDVQACPKVRRTLPGGIVTLSIGGLFAITSAILLGIDETRIRKAKRGVTGVALGPGVVWF